MINYCKLTDVAEMRGRVGWKGYTVEDLVDEGPLVIGANDITSDNQLILNNVKHLTREKYEESPEIFLKKDDLLVVKVGSTIGKVCIINREIGEASINPNCVIVRAKNINPYYLYCYMCGPVGKAYLLNNSSASGQPALNQKDLGNMPIPIVDKSKQEIIAKVFSNLNEKIEINILINSKLESLAKTIYDYWFLQFEFPNEEGKPYKSSGGKMVWNDELKREIPEGWEVKRVEDTGVYISDYTANGSFKGLADNVVYNEGDPYALLIRIVDFNNNFDRANNFIWVNKHAYDYLSKSNLHGDEIIICNVGAVGNVYRCPCFDHPMTLGPNGIVVNHQYLNNYLELYFKSGFGQKQLHSISSGSIQMKFNKTNFRDLQVLIPPKSVLDDFYFKYTPIYEKKKVIWKENRELASLRDFLLPMLMNGQVTFKDENY